MKPFNKYFYIYSFIFAIALTACADSTRSSNQSVEFNRKNPPKVVTLDKNKVVAGQTIYVPIYSHIYHYNSQNHVMNLSATLSIRNTDLKQPIIITTASYYDTEGQLVRQYVHQPIELKPMASTEFFIETDDTQGGSGANFIVEWVAEKPVYDPVIEAVMISTASTQGISFISPGRVLKQHTMKK